MITHCSDYLHSSVLRVPDKVAVKDVNGELTFQQLEEKGKKVASKLIELGIIGKPVGVFLPKSKEAILSFLGINLSGNYYVPMDVKSPVIRLSSILHVLEAEIVITDSEHLTLLKSFYPKTILILEDIISHQVLNDYAIVDVMKLMIDTDPIYCIFTSGSTGTPKGVVISHRGVIDYIDWALLTFKIDDSTIIGNQAPFYFDNSTLDIYLMYATGATLVLVPETYYIFPAKLIDYLNEHQVNFVFWVPYVLINIANLNILATKKPEHLRDILFAGEVMPNKHLNYWRRHLPNCRYANLYGPTEITVDCTWYLVERAFSDEESLPIGYPCKNSDVLILTDNNDLAVGEEQGELCVRGSSLALGYYNDWEKTEAAFCQNPLNNRYPERIYRTGDLVYKNKLGEIIFVGRKDSQIKHLGYRIELGEIETAVLGTHLIDICTVVYDKINKQIVLYYESKAEISIGELRKSLLSFLPKYMIPTVYQRVSEMQCNANGKIDRLFYHQLVNN